MADRPAATALVAWLTLLGASVALSALAAAHDTLPGDTGITSWLQDSPFPGETLSDTVRALTFTQLILGAGAALAALLWLRGYRPEAGVFTASLIILLLLQTGIKELVDRPRPNPQFVDVRAGFSSPSFPSGHVMSATYFYCFLVYVALFLPMPPAARTALASVSIAVLALAAPANVWLGVHWPSDTVGGYAWGLVVLLPAAFACLRLRARRRPFP